MTSIAHDPFFEKGLPSNVEAERSILGAIILDNAVCNQAVELLRREDFFLDSHRRIYEKMVTLSKRGTSIDLITLSEELRKAAEFEQIGGATYIASLIDGVPRTDTIEHYAKIVKAKSQLRKLITASNQIIASCFDEEDDPEIIIDRAEALIFQIAEDRVRLGHRVTPLTLDELAALPPMKWLIPEVIPKQGFGLVVGGSGAGKSFYALDKALRLAQTEMVIYVGAEGQSGYRKRAEAWCEHHKVRPANIRFWLAPVNLLDARMITEFIHQVCDLHPALIIFDTLNRCFIGGEENSSRDMGLFLAGAGRIQQELRCAVLVVHHTGKNGAGERGHSSLKGAADVQIELVNDDGLICVRSEKVKDDAATEPEYLRLLPVGDADDASCVIVPASRVAMWYSPLTQQQRKILEVLAYSVFSTTGAKGAQIQKATGVPEASIYRQLSKLQDKGLIRQADRGEPYFITDAGCEALEPAPELALLASDSHSLSDSSPTDSPDLLASLSHPLMGESDASKKRVGRPAMEEGTL